MKKETMTHGENRSKLHYMWLNMKKRCSPNFPQRKDYYDRGISVCNEWHNNFWEFRNWAIENGYKEGLTIDRINNDKGYFPENCRFVDRYIQNNNTRRNHFVSINGVRKTVSQWAKIYGIAPDVVYCRMRRGWNEVDAITVPKWTFNRGKSYAARG